MLIKKLWARHIEKLQCDYNANVNILNKAKDSASYDDNAVEFLRQETAASWVNLANAKMSIWNKLLG